LNDTVPVDEKGKTFAENAKIKALELSEKLHTTMIATDGGANIPALGHE
jgi:inosine/xanthosine triphosphate pyrophosphatase family protein